MVYCSKTHSSWEIAWQGPSNHPRSSFWFWEDAAKSPRNSILARNNLRFTTDRTELWRVPDVLEKPTTWNTFAPWSSSRTLVRNWFLRVSVYHLPPDKTMAPRSRQRNLQPLQTNIALTTSRLALVIRRVMVSLNVWCRRSNSLWESVQPQDMIHT